MSQSRRFTKAIAISWLLVMLLGATGPAVSKSTREDRLAVLEGKLSEKIGAETDSEAKRELQLELSAIHFAQRKFAIALSELFSLQSALTRSNDTNAEHRAAIEKYIGDCYFKMRNCKKSLVAYNAAGSALVSEDSRKTGCLLNDIEWSKAGTLFALHQYVLSASAYQEIVPRLENQIELAWAHLNLSEVYLRAGKRELARAESDLCINNLKNVLSAKDSNSACSSVHKSARLWHYLYGVPHTAPLISWFSERPNSERPGPLLICVHGLGLDARAYQSLAKKMAVRGVRVFAIDVRGFGSWQSNQGHEDLDLDGCLRDLHALVRAVRGSYPGSAVFLLGESMGGGIAIHAAGMHGQDFDGVIASVPAADRHKEALRFLTVAEHLLVDPEQQFDIGDGLVNSMTDDAELRHSLNDDPDGRKYISARELISFNQFMAQNKKFGAAVTKPILVTQGDRDPLVKESSTITLFHSIAAPDRNLLILGKSEHLIFEANQFSELLLDAVSAWIQGHIVVVPKDGDSGVAGR